MGNKKLPLMARQPILDRHLKVYGYELLCRPVPEDSLSWQQAHGDEATREVLISAFNDIGLEQVTGGLPAFINFTHYWLHNPPTLPKKSFVAEILEHIKPTPENIAAIKALHGKGYRLALDDYQGNPEQAVFFPYLHIVKIDLRLLKSLDELPKIIQRYENHQLMWLAEKVETLAEYDFCKNAGCDLFQGYFFSQPANVYGNRYLDNHMAVMQLLKVLNKDDAALEEVANVLKSDPQLCFKILKVVNSAAFGMTREIASIQQAVLFLGLNQLKTWVNIIALGKLNTKPQVLREHALVRALLCQNLVSLWPKLDTEMAFTVGLFSLLPGFLDLPLEEICKELRLPDALTLALTKRQGDYGILLHIATAMEKGEWQKINWDALEKVGISPEKVEELYLSALQKAQSFLSQIS